MVKKAKRSRSPNKLIALDDFLAEEGKREELEAVAIKEALVWQIMKVKKISRGGLAQHEDQPQSVGRLLNPKDGNVTLNTLQRAARMVGRSLRLGLM